MPKETKIDSGDDAGLMGPTPSNALPHAESHAGLRTEPRTELGAPAAPSTTVPVETPAAAPVAVPIAPPQPAALTPPIRRGGRRGPVDGEERGGPDPVEDLGEDTVLVVTCTSLAGKWGAGDLVTVGELEDNGVDPAWAIRSGSVRKATAEESAEYEKYG